ncbi:hypothetical protein, partial [Escherichia coli]|uniref:hypothetical protein n=1 Tax=Escherichia coli TaxID=562 RepID=UPI001BC88543
VLFGEKTAVHHRINQSASIEPMEIDAHSFGETMPDQPVVQRRRQAAWCCSARRLLFITGLTRVRQSNRWRSMHIRLVKR